MGLRLNGLRTICLLCLALFVAMQANAGSAGDRPQIYERNVRYALSADMSYERFEQRKYVVPSNFIGSESCVDYFVMSAVEELRVTSHDAPALSAEVGSAAGVVTDTAGCPGVPTSGLKSLRRFRVSGLRAGLRFTVSSVLRVQRAWPQRNFSFDERAISDAEPETLDIQVDASTLVRLFSSVEGLGGGYEGTSAGTVVRHHWRWQSTSGSDGTGSAKAVRQRARLTVSTLESLDDASRAILNALRSLEHVTENVRLLSADIVRGHVDSGQRVGSIAKWVRENIRLAERPNDGVAVGFRSADEVIALRRASPLEAVVLARALLAAQGIEARLTLVQCDRRLQPPKVLALPGSFENVMLYVPSIQKYVDPLVSASISVFDIQQYSGAVALTLGGVDDSGRLDRLGL